MRKKLLLLILTIITVLCLGVGLSACGNGNNDDDAQNTEQTGGGNGSGSSTSEVTEYTVTFDANGGTYTNGTTTYSKTVTKNSKVSAPTSPTRQNYIFVGWSTNKYIYTLWSFTSNVVTDNTTLYAIWSIQYDLSDISFNDITYSYDGMLKTITLSGDIPDGLTVTYSNNTLTNVGSKTATARLTDSYGIVQGTYTAVLTIEKGDYDLSSFIFIDTEYTYDGTEKTLEGSGTLPEEVTVTYTENTFINAGTYQVTAIFECNNSNYNAIEQQTVTLTIQKATYDMSEITFEDATYTYDGTEKSIEISGTLPDGVTVEYSNCTQTNAGTYTATASFTVSDENYEAIGDMQATLTIQKATCDMSGITFADGSYTYDGAEKSIEISGTLPDGVTVYYSNNSNINAGTYIVTASFTVSDDNYEAISDMTATLTIQKATYDMSSVTFNGNSYVYDGTTKSLGISGTLPGGVSVTYSNNSNTNAGTYTVTASFVGDSTNYEAISDMTATLTIQKATYDMTGVTFESGSYTYDGTAKSLGISGTLPGGVSVTYSNNSNTNAGEYTVTASFTGDSANYEAISDMTATLTIQKATLSFTMNSGSYTYTGSYYNLAVNETLPDGVSVSYSNNNQINAGTYTVVATITVSSNYCEVENISAVLTINKADVTIMAEDKTSVYGESLTALSYVIVSGTIYNNDFTPVLTKADGDNAGTYTISVTAENSNYNISTINGTYTITKATYDMSGIKFNSVSYVYDGNEKVIEIEGTLPDDIIVSYENNSLTYVGTITATANFINNNSNYESDIESLTAVLIITKATYDMSGVSFDNVTYTYDGTEKQITLTGTIPAGLTVTYENNTLTNTGTVSAVAKFSGDFTNYYTVGSLTATLTIEKADFDLSTFTFSNAVYTYDGSAKTLEIEGTLPYGLTVTYTTNSYINVGTYQVTANFSYDSSNYNDVESQTATLTINKAVYDFSLISFESATYTYDGTAKTIAITGSLPDGVTVVYYNCTKTNVGTYTCTACFTGDSTNYEAISDLTATLTIEKANYDMSAVSLDNATFTYDGTEKSLVIQGNLPSGVTVTYVGNSVTNAGEYTVTASFTGDSANYNAIADLTATLTIVKATPEVTVSTTVEYLTVTDTFELAVTSSVSGTIAATQSVTLTVGANSCGWIFTPNDTDNYNTVSGTLNFTVYVKITYIIQGSTAYTRIVEKGGTAESLDGSYSNNSGYSYTFSFWSESEGGTQFDLTTQLLKDTTLYAVYAVTPVTYYITYELNGGSTSETLVFTYTVEDTVTIPSLTKTGYTFNGWSSDYLTELSDTVTLENATGDRTYTANFTANTYTLTLDADGGTVESTTVTVTYGEVPSVSTPERQSYTFLGWYLNDEKIDISAAWSFAYDVTLTAEWELENPTEIYTVDDLKSVAYDMSANYILMNDIDLDGAEWEMIGDASNPFAGVFDGNGYTISNFTISNTADYTGLFGANSGTINNLNVSGATITSGDIGASIFVGLNNGTVYNCSASGTVNASGTYAGGFAAYNTGTISYCSVNAAVTGCIYVGGLIGYQSGGLTEYSYTTGTLTISDSSSTTLYAGGLICYASDAAKIENSYSKMVITVSSTVAGATAYVGGLIGYVNGTDADYISVSGCYTKNSISVNLNYSSSSTDILTSFVGGLTGYSNYGEYNKSYSTCTITVSVKRTGNGGTYSTSLSKLYYYCYSYIGGLIGYDANGIVNNCYSSTVFSNEVYSISYYYSHTSSYFNFAYAYTYLGGLIGYTSGTEISTSYACGQITSSTEAVATYSSNFVFTIAVSYSYIGGVVGYSGSATTITDSFASIEENNITAIASSDSSSHYSIVNYYGGLAGYSDNLTVTNSYRYSGFDSTVDLGTTSTLSNFKSANFVTGTLGWDSSVWTLVNGSYPSLDLYSAE